MLVTVARMLPAISARRGVLTDAALPSTFIDGSRIAFNQLQDRQRAPDQRDRKRRAQISFTAERKRPARGGAAPQGGRRRLLRIAIRDGFGRWTDGARH